MSGTTRITVMGGLATFLASLALMPAYEEPNWFWPALVVVAYVCAVGHGLRRLAIPRLLVPLAQLAALQWAFILVYARQDLVLGIFPSRGSMQAFLERLNDGLLIVTQYAAPVPGDPDLTMVTTLGIGLIAVAVDLLAATLRLVPWAGLPLLLLYSIPATTVTGSLSALSFIPPAIGYTLLLTSEGRQRLHHWGRVIGFADQTVGPQEAIATSLLGQTGRRVGIAVIGLAVLVPAFIPDLPEGVFGRGRGGGPGDGLGGNTIRVNNPIVDLKRDLQLPEDVEVLRYRTDAEPGDLEYIRMVVLDRFDGRQWVPSQRQIRELSGPGDTGILPDPPGLSPTVDRTQVHSTFELLESLKPKWLPVLYPTVSLRGDADWGYDPDTLDIVNRSGEPFSEVTYELTSLRVHHTAEDLADAGPPPEEIAERYVELPGSVPESVHDLARKVVKDADNPYEQAVALQSWFRSEFLYDLSVRGGHGGSALMDFLADKRGYCEQFAATMAIMARTLGIPARVAVGYMPGQNVEGDTYVVTAHDAHAWPELYFAGHGWVRFEPTPSIQTGAAPEWSVPDTGRVEPPVPPQNGDPRQDPRDPGQRDTPTGEAVAPHDPTRPSGGDQLEETSTDLTPFLLAGLALLLLAAPAVARLVIRRARLSPRNINGGVEQGWQELAATVRDLGMKWDDTATPRATAERFEPMLEASAAEAMHRLAIAVEELRYAPKLPNTPRLTEDVLEVCWALRQRAGRTQRIMAWLLPRSLWAPIAMVFRPVTWLLDGIDTMVPRLVQAYRRRRAARRVVPTHRA